MKKNIILSDEQESVMVHLAQGGNVLVTGPAGTGKSTLLSAIRERFDKNLPVTASTGIAALNVRGMTIHSWAGLKLADEPAETIAENIIGRRGPAYRRITKAKRLALDEVSMIHGDLLDKLDQVLRIVREDAQPFGGLQLILFGDFLQLPPVCRFGPQKFAFHSAAWGSAQIKTFMLNKIFRQTDETFSSALNQIRLGQMTAEVKALLQSRWKVSDPNPSHQPIVVYTHNADVDRENNERLRKIQGEEKRFDAKDSGEEPYLSNIQKNCLAPEQLRLRVGAQVMLLWNLDPMGGLANGTLGKVIAFEDGKPKVRFFNGRTELIDREEFTQGDAGKVLATRVQFPLRLAWCITVHKSQGMTFDKIRVFLDRVFEPGQSYVALSRVKTLEGLFIDSSRLGAIRAHPDALAFYAS